MYPLPALDARHLPGGGIQAIEEVGRGNHQKQGRHPLLVIVLRGLLPDLVRHRVAPVSHPSDGLGERQSSPLGIAKVGSVPPGCDGKEALRALASLEGIARRAHAEATAIDLARPQVNQIQHRLRHPALSRGYQQILDALGSVRQKCGRVAHSWLHDTSHFSVSKLRLDVFPFRQRHRRLLACKDLIETLLPFRCGP